MEVLARYGSPEQRERWLRPLLRGEIRSGFAMTEPDKGSSDATNISASIVRDGDHYILNGRKWWTTGAMHPHTQILIFMGKTDPKAARHLQQSMILVPIREPGVRIVRHLPVFGYDDAPFGHAEIAFENVRVPATNMILGEGRGFEIAQGRLGPGRLHHCLRLLGLSERVLRMMCLRVRDRITFGRPLAEQGVIREWIAQSRIDIDSTRHLVYKRRRAARSPRQQTRCNGAGDGQSRGSAHCASYRRSRNPSLRCRRHARRHRALARVG